MKLAQQVYIGELLDFYGGLLTHNQESIMRSYICYNATLEEIAIQNGTTRQAVSDVVRRSTAKLNDCEARLRLVAKYHAVLAGVESTARGVTNEPLLAEKIAKEFTRLFKTLED